MDGPRLLHEPRDRHDVLLRAYRVVLEAELVGGYEVKALGLGLEFALDGEFE